MCRLIKLSLLPKCDLDPNHKCDICVEAKMTRLPFCFGKRNTKSLDLIHVDACDLKFVQTRSDKK